MGNPLVLVLAALILGIITWYSWPQPEIVQSADQTAAKLSAQPVPFLIKAKVRTILDQQRKVAASGSEGDLQAAQARIRIAVQDIRECLANEDLYGENALQDAIRAATAELGMSAAQASAVMAGVSASGGDRRSGGAGQMVRGVRERISDISGHSRRVVVEE